MSTLDIKKKEVKHKNDLGSLNLQNGRDRRASLHNSEIGENIIERCELKDFLNYACVVSEISSEQKLRMPSTAMN